jgi:hypothetical protein
MQVVRAGGDYLASREQRLWIALASLAALGAAAVTVAALNMWTGFMWVGVLVGLIALSLGPEVFRRLTNVRKGRLGERLVTDLLRRLPDDYWLVNDVMLGDARGNIDHVLIGPCGVVVIETKRLAGHIRCYGDAWSVNGYSRGSISRQVNSNACAVRYFLSECHPDLASTALRWVESVVVFTHPLCRLKVDRSRTTVVRYSEFHQLVLSLAEKCRMASGIAARLAESLTLKVL